MTGSRAHHQKGAQTSSLMKILPNAQWAASMITSQNPSMQEEEGLVDLMGHASAIAGTYKTCQPKQQGALHIQHCRQLLAAVQWRPLYHTA